MTRLERIAELTADRWADARGDRAAGWPARSFAAIAENEMAALACLTPGGKSRGDRGGEGDRSPTKETRFRYARRGETARPVKNADLCCGASTRL